jgi:chemotaxis protein MotA
MHVLIGALLIIGTFLLAFQYMSMDFDGFLNYYALILLCGTPLGLAVMTYRFSTLGRALQAFGRALTRNPVAERRRLAEKLLQFGRAVRSERPSEAASIVDGEKDPLFRHLGHQVIQQDDPDEIEIDALIVGRRQLEKYRAGEKVFSSLGDFAPAMGMIGTVIGLIQLLANMRDFEKLGPGMAIALLTTFYGLCLAHLLYLPIARLIADRRAQRAENLNLVAETMLKIARRRPLHEIQQIIGQEGTPIPGADGTSGGNSR